jgi:hypothetical protein
MSITYMLIKSLEDHISSIWGGDVYDLTGNQTQEAFCPAELEDLFTYEDSDGTERIFGPSAIAAGRIQEDIMSLSRKLEIPSSFIEINSNDPESIEDWRNSIYSSLDSAQKLDQQPVLMVGGANRYFRRLVVKMTTFFIDSDQTSDEVIRLGSAACSMLESMVKAYHSENHKDWAWKMLDENGDPIVDEFGERPYSSYPVISHSRRRGGPPDDYIWDIKIYLEVATFQE